MSDQFSSILALATDANSAESGGGHGNKGSDFQRYWAIWRALKLEEAGQADFLLLFECVQDVLELDSNEAPTIARVYQVKKKDSGEWTWSSLTLLPEPGTKPRKPRKTTGKKSTKPKTFAESVLGKLVHSASHLTSFQLVEGYFVSNAGCTVPLEGIPNNAAAAQECSLAKLAASHATPLSDALKAFFPSDSGEGFPPERLHLHKSPVNPDFPEEIIVALANDILSERLPSHASQSRPFVQSLYAFVSGKGRHTGLLSATNDLHAKRGLSKKDVHNAFAALETVPDLASLRKNWLEMVLKEGMPLIEHGKLSVEVGKLTVNKLAGLKEGASLSAAASEWAKNNPPSSILLPYLQQGTESLSGQFIGIRKEVIQAHLLMEGVEACVAPISEN